MTYRLKLDSAAEAVYDALPPSASEQLSLALAAVCEAPLSATEPYGVDDKIVRTLAAGDVMAVLLLGHASRTVRVLHITHLG